MSGETTRSATWNEFGGNEYWSISVDRSLQIVCARRSSKAVADLSQMDSMAAGLDPLYRLPGHRWSLLVDLREAPMRNDSGFEERMKPHQDRMLSTFRKTAVIVRTAVGRLQVLRTGGDEQSRVRRGVFLGESDAIAYLTDRA